MGENKLDAIIFDFDGTLSRSAPRQEAWFKKFSKMNNKPWPFKDFDHFLTVYNETLYGSGGDVMDGVQKFYDNLELPCDIKANMKTENPHPTWIKYTKYLKENSLGLIPGMKEVLDEIFALGSLNSDPLTSTRLRLGINTTNSWQGIYSELKNAGVINYFHSQIGAEMLNDLHGAGNGDSIKKPSKLSVALSLNNLGSKGARTMHVGDTRTDLMASRGVIRPGHDASQAEDLIMVGVGWGYEGREKLEEGAYLQNGKKVHFDYIIEEPKNLVWLVKNTEE